ncbi:hypothetical protein [Candidatus Raskinella chloraquaticus]|uniref:Uncharacterized protein n=1 Tax=Candidatus Raskinella chloraquaticus TaxID=1951219 RepID=A0A1W9I5L8_9HYPH|nr:MAG: hypothetical protein A4S15_04035 [Proteobacteria bacterium SG_bin8]
MKTRRYLGLAFAAFGFASLSLPAQAAGKQVQVKGEIVDTFCSVSEIMYAYGTAHYQCSVWCAAGGIPVSIKGDDGEFYVVLKINEDTNTIINNKLLTIQAHHVTADGELLERNGVKYILVSQVADDKGVVNLTHDEHGILPFGN